MKSVDTRRDHLHGPWPSLIERLEALYGSGWEIYRELLPGGTHGDWIAKRLRTEDAGAPELRAPTPQSLAEKLHAEAGGHLDA